MTVRPFESLHLGPVGLEGHQCLPVKAHPCKLTLRSLASSQFLLLRKPSSSQPMALGSIPPRGHQFPANVIDQPFHPKQW